jgi:hypothetical protein
VPGATLSHALALDQNYEVGERVSRFQGTAVKVQVIERHINNAL